MNKRFIIAMLIIVIVGLLVFYIYNYTPNSEHFQENDSNESNESNESNTNSDNSSSEINILNNENGIEYSNTKNEATLSISDFKIGSYFDKVISSLRNITINNQPIPSNKSNELELFYEIDMFRFSPAGSLLHIKNDDAATKSDFTMYFLIQFDTNNKTDKQYFIAHKDFQIYKDEGSNICVNYTPNFNNNPDAKGNNTSSQKLNEHKIINVADGYETIYFCVVTYESEDQKLSILFNNKYWFMNDIILNYTQDNDITIGGYQQLKDNYFTGLLGYLHAYNEPKSIHDVCTSEKLCQLQITNCAIFQDKDTCLSSKTIEGNDCYYNMKCVPRLDIHKNDQEKINKCAVHSDEECEADLMCKRDNHCSNDPPASKVITDSVNKKSAKKACTFEPENHKYTKLEQAIIDCNTSGNAKNEDCNLAYCESKALSCKDSKACPWIDKIPNAPKQPIIRCYAGDSTVKILWLKPKSKEHILKYTIFVEDPNGNRDINFNFSNCKGEHCDHMLYELDNDTLYNIFMVATNKFGDSPVSNVVSIKPMANKTIGENSLERQVSELDDSVQQLNSAIKSKNIHRIKEAIDYQDPNKDMDDVLELLSSERINSFNNNTINVKL